MGSGKNLKISIITPTLNQAQFIEETILSVLNQNYPDFEHIVIDGGSKDNTLDILKKYSHLKWVSEKDKGQSDAINKGFRMATGDIVAWINSDDYYAENTFNLINNYFSANPDCSILYGDITYISQSGSILYTLTGDDVSFEKLLDFPDNVRQPSTFWRKEVLEKVGYIKESLHLVMDLEFFLRIGKIYKFHYLPENLSFFRFYENNKTTVFLRKQVFEMHKVIKYYKGSLSFFNYKFLFGRYLDSLDKKNPVRLFFSIFRKGQNN